MVRSAVIVLIVGVVALSSFHVVQSDDDRCPPDKDWHDCASACRPTCDRPNPGNRACTLQCIIGCQCKPGLLEGSNGKCYKPSKCPNKS